MLQNYIYHAKEIIGNKKLELLEFLPIYSRNVFRTQSNVCDEVFFCKLFSEKPFIVDVRLGSKYASVKVKKKILN